MTVSLSPLFNGWQGFGTTGLPLNAGQLFQYAAGTTTPQATFTTNTGLVQNANPIILGPDGRPPQEIWLTDGLSYKFVLMDSLSNTIATYDNIQSVGTLIQNFITSTTFLTQADGRYPIYAGTAGGTGDAITAAANTSITALYNGMIVSIDAIAQNATATPTFTLTLGSTVTATLTIVDYNLQPLLAGAIAGIGHKILLGYNSVQSKWVLINPMPITTSGGTTSRRQTAMIGPVDITGMPSLLPQTVTGLTLTTQNIAGIETVQTANVTTAVASPGVVGWTGHTLVGNQAVSFTTTGALPTGLTVGTTYYVVPGATLIAGVSFEVAATLGGTPINFTGVTSGQSTCWAGVQLPLNAAAWFGNDGVAGELNQIGQATANFTFPALTNNTTNYLYSTISTLGVFTHFVTTLAPVIVYGPTTAPSITSGQITIDVVRAETYLGNGSTSVEIPLVVWGTATTSGGNITATQTYNYGKPPTFSGKLSGTFLKRTYYTTAGTFQWVKSAQTTVIHVEVQGGGGAGGNGLAGVGNPGGNGGAPGGYTKGVFDASSFNFQNITLSAGGTSSFGSLISATGGTAGVNGGVAYTGTQGIPGTGVGGTIVGVGMGGVISAGMGGNGAGVAAGYGTPPVAGFGGTGGIGGTSGAGNGVNGVAGQFGGGGGGGGGSATGSAGTGGAASVGYVIVDEYA